MPVLGLEGEDVRRELEIILKSPGFIRNDRQSRFLRFIVERELEGRHEELKESVIGIEVFGRTPDYDTKLDPIVRTEARRLRARLSEYYESAGAGDGVIIDLPKGGYVPVVRSAAHVSRASTTGSVSTSSRSIRPHLVPLGLRWNGAVSFGLLALVCVGGVVLFRPVHKRLSLAPQRSIAVLPFLDLSADKDQEYFCDGITEELISELARIDGLRVVARTSVFQFKGKPQDVRQVGKQLNVATVVEGSVRKSGNRLRITAQLISVPDGYHLWSESYDRELKDIFDVQEDISRSIASALQVSLADPVIGTGDTSNVEAHNLYLLGRYHWNKRSDSELLTAARDFESAVRLDSAYAQPYAGLADTYLQLGTWASRDPRQMMPKARLNAVKALELNERLAEAHTSLGAIHLLYDWDLAAARREYEKAIALNAGYVTAHWWYAFLLLASGELPNARRELDLALRLDPLSVPILVDAASFQIESGDPASALAAAQRAVELDPASNPARIGLGSVFVAQGRFADALKVFQAAVAAEPDNGGALQFLLRVYLKLGRRSEAEETIARLLDVSKTRAVTCDVASAYAAAGQSDLALDWLERSVEARSTCIGWLRLNRFAEALVPFRALSNTALYRAILAKAVPNQ